MVSDDEPILADALDRLGDGNGQQCRAVLPSGGEDGVDEFRAQARPGGVVDRHELATGSTTSSALVTVSDRSAPPSITWMFMNATLARYRRSNSSRSSWAIARIIWPTSSRFTNGSMARSQTARPSSSCVDLLLLRVAESRRFPGGEKDDGEWTHWTDSQPRPPRRARRDRRGCISETLCPDCGPAAPGCQLIQETAIHRAECRLPGDGSSGMLDRSRDRPVSMRRRTTMECLGPQCAEMLLEWIKARAPPGRRRSPTGGVAKQGLLWTTAPYQEEAPAITIAARAGRRHRAPAIRRTPALPEPVDARPSGRGWTTRSTTPCSRSIATCSASTPSESPRSEAEVQELRDDHPRGPRAGRAAVPPGARADLKLAQLASLTPESFEEFVAELFEALGYEVEQVGGSGDEGADLRLRRPDGLLAVVQCKYHKRGVVGSPVLQKFLGTIHHTLSHKGYFVTTSTFSLAAEKFAAEHPIELVDGPRLVELVNQALGPKGRRETEPAWF